MGFGIGLVFFQDNIFFPVVQTMSVGRSFAGHDGAGICRGGFGVRGHAGPFGRAQSVLHRRLARAFLSLLVGVSSTGRLIVYIKTRPAGGSGLMSSHDFFNISLFTPRLFTPSLAPSLASASWRVSLL